MDGEEVDLIGGTPNGAGKKVTRLAFLRCAMWYPASFPKAGTTTTTSTFTW
jgi:hypothetical protein